MCVYDFVTDKWLALLFQKRAG